MIGIPAIPGLLAKLSRLKYNVWLWIDETNFVSDRKKKIHRAEVFYVNQQEGSKDVKIYRLTPLTSELEGASLSAILQFWKNELTFSCWESFPILALSIRKDWLHLALECVSRIHCTCIYSAWCCLIRFLIIKGSRKQMHKYWTLHEGQLLLVKKSSFLLCQSLQSCSKALHSMMGI